MRSAPWSRPWAQTWGLACASSHACPGWTGRSRGQRPPCRPTTERGGQARAGGGRLITAPTHRRRNSSATAAAHAPHGRGHALRASPSIAGILSEKCALHYSPTLLLPAQTGRAPARAHPQRQTTGRSEEAGAGGGSHERLAQRGQGLVQREALSDNGSPALQCAGGWASDVGQRCCAVLGRPPPAARLACTHPPTPTYPHTLTCKLMNSPSEGALARLAMCAGSWSGEKATCE